MCLRLFDPNFYHNYTCNTWGHFKEAGILYITVPCCMHYNKQCVCVYIKFVRLSCTFAHLQLITLSYVYVINEHTCTCLHVALYIHCMFTHVLADCFLRVLVHVHSMLVCVCVRSCTIYTMSVRAFMEFADKIYTLLMLRNDRYCRYNQICLIWYLSFGEWVSEWVIEAVLCWGLQFGQASSSFSQ